MAEIKVYKVGEVLDTSTSKVEQDAISNIIDDGANVALDLSECKYVSSAGLRVMLYSYKLAATKNLKLYLIGVSSEIREVMRITGFERFFSYFDTVGDCLSQCNGSH